MIRFEMKNNHMILVEKQQKDQHHDQIKLININYLTVEEILPPDQSRKIKQSKFTYSPLENVLKKQKTKNN